MEGSSVLLRTQSCEPGNDVMYQVKLGVLGGQRLGEQLAVSTIDGLSEELASQVRT